MNPLPLLVQAQVVMPGVAELQLRVQEQQVVLVLEGVEQQVVLVLEGVEQQAVLVLGGVVQQAVLEQVVMACREPVVEA